MDQMSSSLDHSFQENVMKINEKIGKEELTDDEIIFLASQSIKKTYTFEEKGYK